MNTSSRERVLIALNHKEPDKIPIDLGAGFQTGMHVQSVYKLRQAFGLDSPGTPVKVIEPYQMLGEIKPDLLEAVGGDVVGINPRKNMFGCPMDEGYKEWVTFDGTPVLVPTSFNTQVASDGKLYQYPENDLSVAPSAVMPEGGYYFDAITRQHPIVENEIHIEDNLEEFGWISDDDLFYFKREIIRAFDETDKAIYANFGGTAFGDIALVPAPWLKDPRGIRDVTEWYVSLASRKKHIYRIFERQCEIALENLRRIFEAVGNKVDVVFLTGTDFAAQARPLMSVTTYRELFLPFHRQLNNWVHQNTTWKTFMHTDGAISSLIPSFIEAGFDILNPVQWTAKGMDPQKLKTEFGEKISFWGGGIDTQETLPFGSPKEVRKEVIARIKDFSPDGGWVFTTVHNVQPMVPVENLLSMYQTINQCR